MSVTDDHRKSATRSRKVVHPPSPSSAVILSAGAFQPERRISRALYPRPEAKGCRGRAVTFASFSTGAIPRAGRFSAGAKDLACTVPAAGGEGMSGSSRHICILLDRRHPERRRFSAGAKDLAWDRIRGRSERIPRGSHPRPKAKESPVEPFTFASLSTGVILSAGAFQ